MMRSPPFWGVAPRLAKVFTAPGCVQPSAAGGKEEVAATSFDAVPEAA
ncbi:hypothetical protein SSCG_01714 [Streptomyces clavuligerus]|nr:hypothetical protein SSCG_01714 [Streptomyces clavuligerus]